MFMFHVSYALELIALACGIAFLIWSMREKGRGVVLAKIFGYIITIISIIVFLCTLWSNFAVWRIHQQMMRNIQMQPMMMQQMMQQRMLQMKMRDNKPAMPLRKPQTNSSNTTPTPAIKNPAVIKAKTVINNNQKSNSALQKNSKSAVASTSQKKSAQQKPAASVKNATTQPASQAKAAASRTKAAAATANNNSANSSSTNSSSN